MVAGRATCWSASARARWAASTPTGSAARRGRPCCIRLARIFGPLPRLLIALGNAITPGRASARARSRSEAELRDLVDLAEERGVIEHGERDMIHSVFELGDTIAREVMVPRTDMVCIERDKTVRQALALALRSGFSRIPVVGENVDDVVGDRLPQGHGAPEPRAPRAASRRAGRDDHAAGHVRAGDQAGRRAAARDAGAADPPGHRDRRVRRHRRPGHDRGHPRGDRRARSPTSTTRSSRRSSGSTTDTRPGHRPAAGRGPGRAVRRRASRTTTSRPSAACWPSARPGADPGRRAPRSQGCS